MHLPAHIAQQPSADELTFDSKFASRLSGSPAGRRGNRRRLGRVKPECLECNLGEVLDFSAAGLRVLSRRPVRGRQQVVLIREDKRDVVRAEPCWTRQVGYRKHETGFRFVRIGAQEAALLKSIGGRT